MHHVESKCIKLQVGVAFDTLLGHFILRPFGKTHLPSEGVIFGVPGFTLGGR